MKRLLPLLACFTVGPLAHGGEPAPTAKSLPAAAKKQVDFVRDVRPIFARACISCHSADKQRGGVRLDDPDEAAKGSNTGPFLVPGDGAKSRLLTVVAGLDAEVKMPPGERKQLSTEEVALLRAWIDQGAKWPKADTTTTTAKSDHWAFQPIANPKLPQVKNEKWVRVDLDRFVLARLEKEGLSPAPEADRLTLMRRVYLDLTGLLPTPQEVEQYEQDTRPDAYERLVDRLLASPHYGERWGRRWLDVARYADSDGYEKDSGRPFAYRWRDWVIDALNRDLPYDQFVIEQLAGDLLPGATVEQKIATGFHRNTLTNREGGVDQEQFRVEAVVDRVNTTATVFLGITLGCAQCHDHKYDPFSHREYYQFFAFFNSDSEVNLTLPLPKDAPKGAKPEQAQTLALGKERKTHIHVRGDFLRKGVEVQPDTLACLPPLEQTGADSQEPNRLSLARWIVDPANPLTRRVLVNWVWHKYFGRGIVPTLNDFGTQGEKPSHPELLDHLATMLLRDGWSLKALHKLIVTSATYRQSSRTTPELLERDPYNELLARQSRLRLEAEVLRDINLTASGLLVRKVGGPSVRPPQPPGVSEVTYANSAKWAESKGPDRYRRGLYIWFQRTSPYPMLMTFDASDANVCAVKRERSNTPLQALTLLNDIVFVECAQALGKRIVSEKKGDEDRLRHAFRVCLMREPAPEELARLRKLHADFLELCKAHPQEAARMVGAYKVADVSAPETASWMALARTLLNLDEFITRE